MSTTSALPELGDSEAVYIIDLNAYVWRCVTGAQAGASAAFARWLGRVMEQRHPATLIFADDSPGPTFRHEMLAEAGLSGGDGYKGDRKKDAYAVELHATTKQHAHELISDMGLPVFVANGYEADDVAASLIEQRLGGLPTIVVTTDRDQLQLVSESAHVMVWDGYHAVYRNDADVHRALGVNADRVADYFALVGGKNNVPGVKKIGDVAARELLAKHSLPELLANAYAFVLPQRWEEEMGVRQKLGSLLREDRKMAELSLRLTRLRTDAPLRLLEI